MKTENFVIMRQAREALRGKWGLAIGASFIYFLIIFIVESIPTAGGLISLVISGPMSLGLVIFSLALSRNQNPHLDQIFDGFKIFSSALGAYLLMILFTILWALLFLIPGIIAQLSYSMTFFIIADNVGIGSREAIRRSKKMMHGYKWKLFCLHFRFLGWAVLSILTLGIGFLWLVPYYSNQSCKVL